MKLNSYFVNFYRGGGGVGLKYFYRMEFCSTEVLKHTSGYPKVTQITFWEA